MHGEITGVERRCLSVGDYGCKFENGWEPPFYFERKALGDLYGTMGAGYPRFKKELARARAQGVRLMLIVEATLGSVASGYAHSQMSGDSMVKKLFTLRVRYGLEAIFCDGRREMARYIKEFYCAIGREYLEARVERNSGLLAGKLELGAKKPAKGGALESGGAQEPG